MADIIDFETRKRQKDSTQGERLDLTPKKTEINPLHEVKEFKGLESIKEAMEDLVDEEFDSERDSQLDAVRRLIKIYNHELALKTEVGRGMKGTIRDKSNDEVVKEVSIIISGMPHRATLLKRPTGLLEFTMRLD